MLLGFDRESSDQFYEACGTRLVTGNATHEYGYGSHSRIFDSTANVLFLLQFLDRSNAHQGQKEMIMDRVNPPKDAISQACRLRRG
jgi:hypothetical protein